MLREYSSKIQTSAPPTWPQRQQLDEIRSLLGVIRLCKIVLTLLQPDERLIKIAEIIKKRNRLKKAGFTYS
jgi:hypothetical protein